MLWLLYGSWKVLGNIQGMRSLKMVSHFFFLNFIKNSFESFFLVVDVFCEEKVHGQESVSPRAVVVQRYVLPTMHESVLIFNPLTLKTQRVTSIQFLPITPESRL